ncbi:Uncharacterised protein [Escherichia coli]|nr:hypothetical protein ESMG_00106 [Escherichia coli M919]CTS59333.1 Uncharacterised protein [Escherichia coli]CTU12571.1 Uncharacterised protein [Escherichia coli]CTY55125.1 Uncharacterised protein [Escherichia coli]CTY64890.1 Uncharacterised protein [Escherichia coli]
MRIEICIVTKKMTNGTIAVNELEFLLPKLLSSIINNSYKNRH